MLYSVAPTYNAIGLTFPDPFDIYIEVPILKNRLCWNVLVKWPFFTVWNIYVNMIFIPVNNQTFYTQQGNSLRESGFRRSNVNMSRELLHLWIVSVKRSYNCTGNLETITQIGESLFQS